MEIKQLQKLVTEWADKVFPERTSSNALTKLVMHEIPELLLNTSDPLEYADVIIIILDVASLNGIDIESAIKEKMAINETRKWEVDQKTGLMSHVR